MAKVPKIASQKHTCANCGNHFQGKFCNACGQSADEGRISYKSILDDLQYGFLHINYHGLYTAKNLLLNPGHFIRGYLAGKRIHASKPLSFVLVLSSLYLLVTHFAGLDTNAHAGEAENETNRVQLWLLTHYSLSALISIPLYAVATFLVFYRYKYNFVEHLAVNAFLASQRTLIQFISLPILYFFNQKETLFIYQLLVLGIELLFFVWSIQQFLGPENRVKIILKSLLSYTLTVLLALGIIKIMTLILH